MAATELGVSVSDVYVSDTATDKCANTSPTAASVSADLIGLAIKDACEQITKRLEPYRIKVNMYLCVCVCVCVRVRVLVISLV